MTELARFKAALGALRRAGELGIVVGAPGETREAAQGAAGQVLTQGQLMAIHEYGDPSRGIPERPVLRMTLKQERAAVLNMLAASMQDALTSKTPDALVERGYERAALYLESKVKQAFGSSELAPNAPQTVARKGSNKPLIDTGELRRSIEGRVVQMRDLPSDVRGES